MKDRKKQELKLVIIVVIVIGCFLYLNKKVTYSSYESNLDSKIVPNIANWDIYINDNLITTSEQKTISIKDIVWKNNHAADNKVAPGSKGKLDITIDPKQTDVAIKYEIEIIDKKVDSNKILTVTNIDLNDNQITKTEDNIYNGIISIDDIKNEKETTISLDIEWINDDTVNDLDKNISSLDDYIVINFNASQYRG